MIEQMKPDKTPNELMKKLNQALKVGMTEEEVKNWENILLGSSTIGELLEMSLELENIEWREVNNTKILIDKHA